MIRSRSRPVVFPQCEHARMAGELALAWRERPPLPFESFVAGVALHDRGYGVLDADDLERVSEARWLEIQRNGFTPRGHDPVTDMIVALHVRRLVGEPRQADFEAALPLLIANAGVDMGVALAADDITNVCDRIALGFCRETIHSGTACGFSFAFHGGHRITIDPWPFVPTRLSGLITGYEAEGYPTRLEPVLVPYDLSLTL